ncbi:MAG TPA: tetratricopeptide repeat protein [Burkholderiales bacterium]|nr:tetratricopeptide repeat protein [Burkholderiales bacterium]
MSDKRVAPQKANRQPFPAGVAAALFRAERALDRGDVACAEGEARSILSGDAACAEVDYLLGEIARQRGEPIVAEKNYRAALRRDSEIAGFHHALANVLQDQGRLEEAVHAYRRALRLAPGLAEAWNDLGTAYFKSGQQARAADCYRKALALAPGHAIALSNLGATLRAAGDVRGAFRVYRAELWQRLRVWVRFNRRRPLSRTDAARRWLARGSLGVSHALAQAARDEQPSDVHALELLADIAQHQGELARAVALLEQSVQLARRRPDLWFRLGIAQYRSGHHSAAVAALRNAQKTGDRSTPVTVLLAHALAASGEAEQALRQLERAAAEGGDLETWTALGRLRLQGGDRQGAEQALDCAVSLQATHAPALAQLARLRIGQQRFDEALSFCQQAVEADPSCAEAHYWRGRALACIGQWAAAVESFEEAVALDPQSVVSARWHAIALRAAARLDESFGVLRSALARHPGNFELESEWVMSIYESGDVARARDGLEKLLAGKPDHPRGIAAMSGLLNAEGRLEEAETYARRALSLEPGQAMAHQNLGLALLKGGTYGEGWDHFEWRTQSEELVSVYRRFPFPEWDGSDLTGKTILVYAEQGLGDEIMFASCLPELERVAGRVVLECEPRLGPLFARSFPRCRVFARERTEANAWARSLEPSPDFQIPIGSLPRRFRRQREDFPRHQGYLKADAGKLERWRSRLASLGNGRKLGLAWRGGLLKTGKMRRSLGSAELGPLLKRKDAVFVSLQYGDVRDEIAGFERAYGIQVLHAQEAIDDYDECAALVCALDGVVSVCTAVVHLTGALGRPCLVMAPYSPEWRYGMSGDAMPWYPSVRVLRQRAPGEWAPVIADVLAALDALPG